MNLNAYKQRHLAKNNKQHLVDIADQVGSSYAYIWDQLAGGFSRASPQMAVRLEKALRGKVKRSTIRPDIYC